MTATQLTPSLLSPKETLLAEVLRSRKPGEFTDPLVGLAWYQNVRDIAQVFFPVASDEWYEFVKVAGYLG